MSKLVIVGGSRGLGFALLSSLYKKYNECVVIDVISPLENLNNVRFFKCDISKDVDCCFDEVKSADCLIITAGIGHVKPFIDCSIIEIEKTIVVNTLATIKIIRVFYDSLLNCCNKSAMVISSIAGEVSSPLFATYGASKSAISKICESLNIELEMANSSNRITCVTATSFDGTSFSGGETDIKKLSFIVNECLDAINNKETKLYINKELCEGIVQKYLSNKHDFGVSSYKYKIDNNRLSKKNNIVIGYLSGTFDLFHIGHLNLLKRAKNECDYLIVGVHESGSWKGKETFIPFEERLEIIRSIKFVDEADKSFDEDSDAWNKYHYDVLFVGSDYKGSERFKKYEEFFKDKGVKIIYFPYTKGTSSTQLREKLSSLKNQ